MTVYKDVEGNYCTLVAHDLDVTDDASEYFGLFEYSVTAYGEFVVYDITDEDTVDVSKVDGLNGKAVAELLEAYSGYGESVGIREGGYFEKLAAYDIAMNDDIIRKAVASYDRVL